jgi:hypothetical protein
MYSFFVPPKRYISFRFSNKMQFISELSTVCAGLMMLSIPDTTLFQLLNHSFYHKRKCRTGFCTTHTDTIAWKSYDMNSNKLQ